MSDPAARLVLEPLKGLPVESTQESKDGKSIDYDTLAEDDLAIYRVPEVDGKLEIVVSLRDLPRPACGSFGSWAGLTT
ncbi:MAG: hypothetical protein ACM3NO_02960 [Deltaproteobacteria bacterium]